MAKPFKVAILRARHDSREANIPDQACLEMLMTGPRSVMKYWQETTHGYFDFLDSAMFRWVDVTIDAAATGRGAQARAAIDAVRAREPGRDPLAGFNGVIVLTLPGRMDLPNPKAGQPGEPATTLQNLDGGKIDVDGLPVAVLPVMSSDHTFMCHELGHMLAFEHTFGLDNNGADWAPDDSTIIVTPEYGSPYDLMSSASFGTRTLGAGPRYGANPTFLGPAVANWPLPGATQMGPHLSAANLHRWFPDALGARVDHRPFPAPGEIGRVRLAARSSAGGKTLLVLHPPGEPGSGVGRVYVEYRNAKGWDEGLDLSGSDLAQAGIVVHTLDEVAGVGPRAWYRGSVAIQSSDPDLQVATRPVVVTLEAHGEDGGNGWADITYRMQATPRARIPWVNASDGGLQFWIMNSGRVASRVPIVAQNGMNEHSRPPWRVVGTGDFSGDGRVSMLWANVADGTMQLWTMDVGKVVSRDPILGQSGLPEHGLAPWHIVGIGDFSGNGKADLLWANVADGTMQIWLMDGGKVVDRTTVVDKNGFPEHSAFPWRIAGIGDFSGNGKADILWVNVADETMQIWHMDGGKVVDRTTVVGKNGLPEHSAPPWQIVRVSDFNRDNKADILWLNTSDRTMQIWMMDGGLVSGRVPLVGENGQPERSLYPWNIIRNADANFNDTAEVVWHNSVTGEARLWFMDGYRVRSRATLIGENGSAMHIGPPWKIVGSSDFNLNDTADLLFQNSANGELQIWFMNAYQIKSRATVVGEDGRAMVAGPPWSIVGCGDFSLDGSADILWLNSVTGEIQIWFMNGYQIKSRATVVGEDGRTMVAGPPWSIVGCGDFSLDGSADILWLNSVTGEIQIWFMNGYRIRSRATVVGEDGRAMVAGPPWRIVGCSDFNLDGGADLLWHNSASGETQIWFMNGYRIKSRATVLAEDRSTLLVAAPWSIVGAY